MALLHDHSEDDTGVDAVLATDVLAGDPDLLNIGPGATSHRHVLRVDVVLSQRENVSIYI